MNSCINKILVSTHSDSLCLFVIHVSDRTPKVPDVYCGKAKTIAPHILVKWLPDDVTWWKARTLEVAVQYLHIN